MIKLFIQSARVFIILLVLCCLVYPAIIYGVGNGVFKSKSTGSIIYKGDVAVGSKRLGQPNSKPQYFWPRPTAKDGGASNLPFTSKEYAESVKERIAALEKAHSYYKGSIPMDMATTSASGLDPHISPEAAIMQIRRVAKARNMKPKDLLAIVAEHTQGKQWGVFGARRVNVLLLNIALDEVDANG